MAYQPKSYKKFVATAATATLVATAVAPTALAADFTDVNANYKNAVDYLVDQGIAQGFDETTFGTTSPIKRGDAAVMIAKALGLNTATAPDAGFTDLNARVAGAVNAIVAEGIASGKTSTTFAPDLYITRQEMAKIIANAYGLTGETVENTFTDVNDNWDEYVDALLAAGITFGYNETTFGATDDVTRGQFALFIYRAEGQPYDVAAVESLTFNAEGDQFVLKFAEALPEDADLNYVLENYEVLVNGAAPSQATIDALKLSATVSADHTAVTVSHTDLDDLASALGGTSVVLSIGGKADTYVFDIEPGVVSVTSPTANEVVVKFNTAVDEDSLINSSTGQLNGSNIEIDDVSADGKFASLSADGKTLTIQLGGTYTANKSYKFEVLNNSLVSVDTVSGAEVPAYVGTFITSDTTRATFENVTYLNPNTAVLNFSELVNETASLVGATYTYADGSGTAPVTVVGNTGSAKDYIVFDLAGVTPGKDIKITLAKVTDLAGNVSVPVQTTVKKDNTDTVRPSVQSITATSPRSFTIKFSEALDSKVATTPGTIKVNNVVVPVGDYNISSSDRTLVTVTLDSTTFPTPFSSSVPVIVDANVFEDYSDNSNTSYNQLVNFGVDTTLPVISSNRVYSSAGENYLELTFSEKVTTVGTADLVASYVDRFGVTQTYTIPAANVQLSADGKKAAIKLEDDSTPAVNLPANIQYSLDVPKGYFEDLFANDVANTKVSFNVNGTSSQLTLAATTPIVDETLRGGTLLVNFASGVNVASATNPANYSVEGATVSKVELVSNSDTAAQVRVFLTDNTVELTGLYNVTVSSFVIDSFGTNLTNLTLTTSEAVTNADGTNDYALFIDGVEQTTKAVTVATPGTAQNTLTVTVAEDLSDEIATGKSVRLVAKSTINIQDGNNNVISTSDIVLR